MLNLKVFTRIPELFHLRLMMTNVIGFRFKLDHECCISGILESRQRGGTFIASPLENSNS